MSAGIGEVKIETLNIYGGNFYIGPYAPPDTADESPVDDPDLIKAIVNEAEAIKAQQEAGASEEDLADLGYKTEAASKIAIVEPGETEDPEKKKKTASAIAIKPQNIGDIRKQIGLMNDRNEHLMEADAELRKANSEKALLERVKKGLATHPNRFALEGSIKKHKRQAKAAHSEGCADCKLNCQIRGEDNFPAWGRVHGAKKGQESSGQEPDSQWHSRLMENPEAPCLPPKRKQEAA